MDQLSDASLGSVLDGSSYGCFVKQLLLWLSVLEMLGETSHKNKWSDITKSGAHGSDLH